MTTYQTLTSFIEENPDYKEWKFLAYSASSGFELSDTHSPIFDATTTLHRNDDDDNFFIDTFANEAECINN